MQWVLPINILTQNDALLHLLFSFIWFVFFSFFVTSYYDQCIVTIVNRVNIIMNDANNSNIIICLFIFLFILS